VGSAISPVVLGLLAIDLGWQAAVLLGSIPTFIMAAIWLWYARDDPHVALGSDHPSSPEGRAEGAVPGMAGPRLLSNRSLWLLTLGYLLQGYISYVFVFWFFHYLVEVRHFSMLESSWLATMPWLLTIITTPLGGLISDRLVRRLGYPWGRRLLPMLALVLAGGLLIFGTRVEHPDAAVVLLTICEGLVMSVEGPFWASMIEVAGEDAGAGGGILNTGGNVGGILSAALTPVIAKPMGWETAFGVAAALSALSGLLWLWIAPGRVARPEHSKGVRAGEENEE